MNLNSLLSSVCGGLFVLFGVFLTDYFNNKKEHNHEKKRINNFRSALLVEIKTYYSLYFENIREALLQKEKGAPFLFYYPITQDNYFSVYEQNVDMLGLLSDQNERELIVEVYARIKAIIDTYRFNNSLIEKYELISCNSELVERDKNKKSLVDAMVVYADLIVESDKKLVNCVNRLIEMMDKKM
nr:hypothetical protein [uncultured Pseudodesulfovibrio sp.]